MKDARLSITLESLVLYQKNWHLNKKRKRHLNLMEKMSLKYDIPRPSLYPSMRRPRGDYIATKQVEHRVRIRCGLTNGRMNNSASLDRVPVSFHAEVAGPPEDERADPHGKIWDGSKGAGGSDVEFQHVCHVLGKICHHSVVAPVMTDLEYDR